MPAIPGLLPADELPVPAEATGFEERHASISPCGLYRYSLTRRWGRDDTIRALWILFNPSTGDASRDDPTIRRVRAFTRREGFGGFTIVNLFARRTVEPGLLRNVDDPIGPANDEIICQHVRESFDAWGAMGWLHQRADEVESLLPRYDMPVRCLGLTKGGHPRHPLYVPGEQRLEKFR